MPEPPVTSFAPPMAPPMARRSSSATASTTASRRPALASSASASWIASKPCRTTEKGTSPTSPFVWCASQRRMSGSVMGVSGWFCMPLSLNSTPLTKRWPLNSVRPVAGKTGQTTATSAPSRSISASATGPILPSFVESKVEQYLNRICVAPCASSHSQAASDWATASAAGMVRLFSATTPASQLAGAGPGGMPTNCIVAMPPLARVLARSLAPVKSSAMQPRSMGSALGSIVVTGLTV